MPGIDMRVGEPRFGGDYETIRNKRAMLTSEMTSDRDIAGPIIPRQRKRVRRKFIGVGDVQRGGQRCFLADLIWSNYLGDFQNLGVIGLQIGKRYRTVRCTKVDAKTETCAHELKVSVCIVCRYSEWAGVSYGFASGPWLATSSNKLTSLLPSLLQLDFRRGDCWQSLGIDPENAWEFHPLRFPAAMDERPRGRPCSPDVPDQTILIGCISHGNGDE